MENFYEINLVRVALLFKSEEYFSKLRQYEILSKDLSKEEEVRKAKEELDILKTDMQMLLNKMMEYQKNDKKSFSRDLQETSDSLIPVNILALIFLVIGWLFDYPMEKILFITSTTLFFIFVFSVLIRILRRV